ncbi:hypothetical protein CCS01_28010 [Rhodopila globiformis]|uniref:Uncharacterized protein n=1 Tax=Rhodopila globiformis TaxID=1071 RepID=A0A2S6MXS3_RHOGL|nr:hypothetical protein CCS01_28010 [Rhodopila globiformis]
MQDATPASDQDVTDRQTAAPHPEEMKGTVTFNLGRFATMTATGRATPAGLVSAALLAGVILIPLAWMIRRRR